GGGGSQDPSSIRATDAASLFRSSNFERALGAARSQLGTHAQLDNFVVYPGYLAVSAVKSGHLVEFYVDANGRSSTTSTSASAGDTSLFSLARVKAEAPAGLTKRIAKLGHTPESQLHYMVARTDPINGKFEWLVYPLEGNRVEYYQAVGGTGPL